MDHPTQPNAPTPPASRLADRSAAARAARAALALVVAVLAVTAVGSGAAEAAPPPALTATPNPVVIPYGQTTGRYELSWSTGSDLPAQFTYSVNGGTPIPFPQTPSGTVPDIPIDIGQTHTYTLSVKGGRPLRTVTVTTRRPDQSCLGTCIKDVTFSPHGTYADVKVIATAKLATYEVTARKAGEPVSSAMIGWDTATWVSKLLSLDPGTTYLWDLKVRDESGNVQTLSGTFTTLKRQVTVNWTSITVTDDSDDLSEGDLHFFFNTNGNWDSSNVLSAGIDSGETVNPGYSATVVGAPDLMKIGLYGWDDDCDIFDGLCTSGMGPGGSDGGSHGEADWATAWTKVNTLVSGPGEVFTTTFSVSTSAYALKFEGSGNLVVTYV